MWQLGVPERSIMVPLQFSPLHGFLEVTRRKSEPVPAPTLCQPSHGKWVDSITAECPPSAFGQNGGYVNELGLRLPTLSWWRAQVSRRKQRALGGGHTCMGGSAWSMHLKYFSHPLPHI